MQIFAGSPAQAALAALALLTVVAEPGDRPDSSALSTGWQPVDDTIGMLSPSAACQFDVKAKNTLSHDVWILFTEASVYSDRINFHRTDLGDEQNKRLTPGEEHTERVEAPGSCGAPRTWFFFVRVGERGADRVQIRRRTEGERHRTIDLGDSSCWAVAPRTTDNDEADRFVPPARDAIGCEPPGSTRAGLEAGEDPETESGSMAAMPVGVESLEGNWLRRDSNNPQNDGMRISVEGDRATLTAMPGSGHGAFRIGHVLWKGISNDGRLEVRGSNGRYYGASITMEGANRLHIDIDDDPGPGYEQTWQRAGPSIDGDWVLVDASDGRNEGLRVAVQGDRAAVAYVPATAERGIRSGAVLWREIGAGDEHHLGRLESLADGRTYESARFRLLDADRLRLDVGSSGTRQLWARPGVAEELAAADRGAEAQGDGADSSTDLTPVSRTLRDPFLEALVSALSSPKRSAIEAALSDCDAALSAEDVGALETCITEARSETASADLPDDRALIGPIDLFLLHIEGLLSS